MTGPIHRPQVTDPGGPFLTRRQRIDSERARRARPRPARSHRLAVRVLAGVSVLALVGAAALPAVVNGMQQPASAAQVITAAGQHASAREIAVPATRDGYQVEVAAPLLRSSGADRGRLLDIGQLTGQVWAIPTIGHITDGYGPRPQKPVPGVSPYHEGTDIAGGCGAAIYAATDGIVVEAGWNGTYGNWILLDHGAGIQTGYAHIQNGGIQVAIGDQVTAGQQIALAGATGAASGCHLHFETRISGTAVNAVPFMARRGVDLT